MHYLVIFIITLVLTTYFSVLETALISVNEGKIKSFAETGDNKYRVFYEGIKNKTDKISSLRLLIVTGVVIGSFLFTRFSALTIFNWILSLNITVISDFEVYVAYIIGFILSIFFFYTFEYLAARRFGLKDPDNTAFNNYGKIVFITSIMKPFVTVNTFVANTFVKLFGVDPSKLDVNITEEEIRMMVDAGGGMGSIDENEMEMINNIFEFDNTSVEDIATHRTDIVAVPVEATIEDIKRVINEEKYSRIPVYEDNIDNIVGIFHIKDFVKYILNDNNKEFDIKNIIMEPYFIPISKKTDELFEEMQVKKIHMAIVIDEYGGTAGIVTMEDLLEEIVGNIFDEYDVEEKEDIETIENGVYIMNGSTDIYDVEEFLGVKFEDIEDYDTLGGYLIGELGRVPNDDERPEIEICGYNFKIVEFDDKRINLVKVTKI